MSAKVAQMLQTRMRLVLERFGEGVHQAFERQVAELLPKPMSPRDVWTGWYRHSVNVAQRSMLLWAPFRVRGNDFIEHERQGLPPVLHFDYPQRLGG